MSSTKFVNIARLMTSYNFEIEQLPDNLKCAQCKLVLKDACQVSCGCAFCRMCIDDLVANGVEFCPGDSDDCGETALSTAAPDYRANKSVSRLTVKCVHDGCVHKCQLANMEEHLRECQRKSEESELGCTQDKSDAEELGGHLQRNNRRHSEILIEMVANINREIDMLKQELLMKDRQIRSIMDQLIHVENENKSMAREKADLAYRVTILSEKMEQEIEERRENDELDSGRVIDHVDMEIAAVREVIGSNKDELTAKINSVSNDVGSINLCAQSIKYDTCSMKSQLESIQEIVWQADAKFQWVIDLDVENVRWYANNSKSDYFTGVVHPYKYRLASNNHNKIAGALTLWLQIHVGPNDGQLAWPFEGRVIITVADRERYEVCRTISLQCRIDRPSGNDYKDSGRLVFRHSELKEVGLNLTRGVRVFCAVFPGWGR